MAASSEIQNPQSLSRKGLLAVAVALVLTVAAGWFATAHTAIIAEESLHGPTTTLR